MMNSSEIGGPVAPPNIAYWKECLSGDLPVLELATDRPRAAVPSRKRASAYRELPLVLVEALEELSQREGVTLFIPLMSAFITLLHRYTEQSDILVGTPSSSRPGDPLVVRARIDGDPSFLSFMQQVAEVIAAARAHEGVPFGALLAELRPAVDTSRHPLFQAAFELRAEPDATAMEGDTRAELDLDLSLSVWTAFRGLRATIVYSTDLFDADRIERMLAHLHILLAGVASDPQRPLSVFPLLTAAERYQILVEWNDTTTACPKDACIHELFEAQVERTPDAIAATCGSRALTYRALNRCANRLARRLKARGVRPDMPVGIFAERSLSTLIGLLGVLKAGGAYVPLDPKYPDERLRLMLRDTEAPILVGRREQARRLSFEGEVVVLDEDAGPADDEGPASGATAEDLAYIMFTSGSTGRPKGVAIPHRAVVRLVVQTNYIAFGPSDRVMHASSLSFDASTFEIWGALLSGARVVMASQDVLLSPNGVTTLSRMEGITAMFLTTALFHELASADPTAFQGLSCLVVGGDVLSPKWCREVLQKGPPGRLVNGYGPTENTTFSTTHLVRAVPDGASSVPIGRPISNTRVYVLDRHFRPVPVGIAGELYVAGDGLARGYLNRPELTAERFVENPVPEEPGPCLYKTGDRARYLPDGSIEFLGRIDAQVKIRGFRVELGEIEMVLAACPTVRDAVVVVREDAPGDKRLVAYVVLSHAPEHVRRKERAVSRELRRFLKERLPEYMVPSSFVVMRALPSSPSGKVDRRALPTPGCNEFRSRGQASSGSLIQAQLVEIWAQVLDTDWVEDHDDFFELGGDSLLVARMLLRLQEAFRIEVPVQCLFQSPTVAGLARIIEDMRKAPGVAAASKAAIDLRKEAILDPEIQPGGAPVEDGGELRHVFLTGATGFLGAFLLHDLLKETSAKVHCLVRAGSTAAGFYRIQRNLEAYSLWDPSLSDRIVAVPGDLTMPLLGLTEGRFDELALQVDALYHSGAEISYVKPYTAHKAANVFGTHEILRLACRGRAKPLNYISTIAVFGDIGYFTGVEIVREGDDLDASVDYLHTDMGYSQSKWVAESLVQIARSRGAPVTIYRPGFIMGHTRTGVTNLNDFVSKMIKGCVQMGWFPELPDQSKECVPVDYVSRAIVHLSHRKRALGKVFHLVPPPPQRVDLLGFFELIRAFGYPLKKLSYDRWIGELIKQIKRFPDNPLLPLMPMLTEKVYQGSLTRWEMYRRMPVYDCQTTLDELSGTSIVCPPLDASLLGSYLSYYIQRGFLEPPRAGEGSTKATHRDDRGTPTMSEVLV
jgi:amino acid adenylation domain-containing protein/thioester reductase-like protein